MHRRYVPYSHAHYAGNLVDGAYGLGLFGDVATELCIRSDGDEGLFASYSDVQFLAPVRAGRLHRGDRGAGAGRHPVADDRVPAHASSRAGAPTWASRPPRCSTEPLVATTARGVVVVPPRRVATDTPDIERISCDCGVTASHRLTCGFPGKPQVTRGLTTRAGSARLP